ncbi:MAG: winged helix-turn-helix transcriptional regulator [Chloroflexi bacterium]|nr:winged helix-turn-helix transcriptional regulator [Chloroflexota bacterium]
MLQPILGSISSERVLLYLFARREGYAREIARFYSAALDPIQKQLEKLEAGGVLASRSAGRTRLYTFDPRYPFMKELLALLEKALAFYPRKERERLLLNRRRPRRKGKPDEANP